MHAHPSGNEPLYLNDITPATSVPESDSFMREFPPSIRQRAPQLSSETRVRILWQTSPFSRRPSPLRWCCLASDWLRSWLEDSAGVLRGKVGAERLLTTLSPAVNRIAQYAALERSLHHEGHGGIPYLQAYPLQADK